MAIFIKNPIKYLGLLIDILNPNEILLSLNSFVIFPSPSPNL